MKSINDFVPLKCCASSTVVIKLCLCEHERVSHFIFQFFIHISILLISSYHAHTLSLSLPLSLLVLWSFNFHKLSFYIAYTIFQYCSVCEFMPNFNMTLLFSKVKISSYEHNCSLCVPNRFFCCFCFACKKWSINNREWVKRYVR